MLIKLRNKLGINNNYQFIAVLLTFSLAGSSVVFARELVFFVLGFDDTTKTWIKVTCYMVLILPTYQLLLLFYALFLGQFNFFWQKAKKTKKYFLLFFKMFYKRYLPKSKIPEK